MLPLADLQRAVAHAVMTGEAVPAVIHGRLRPEEAMCIHRNTVLGTLTGALRLSHPTVGALVGEAFFDQAAIAFTQTQPPRTASLARYGEGFADFLAGFVPTLPYLADVARLDFAIERALQSESGTRRFALGPAVAMILPQSLTVLALQYPAVEIRAAIGDDAALARIAPAPTRHHLLVWRHSTEARLRPVGILTGCFLRSLLGGMPAPDALVAAGNDQAATLAQLQAEIFAAPFCSIVSNPEGIKS
jgi:hypothetical protein